LRFYDQESTIYVLCNVSVDAGKLARRVADIILEQELAPVERVTTSEETASFASGSQTKAELTDAQIDAFIGHWQVPSLNIAFEIAREDGGLIFYQAGQGLAATPLSDQTIEIPEAGMGMTFSGLDEGRFTSLVARAQGTDIPAERRTPASPDIGLLGTYYSEELDVRYVIQLARGTMEIGPAGDSKSVMFPGPSKDLFEVPSGSITLNRNNDTIEGFTLDAAGMAGFYFHRL
jgi:hypothetical protein